MNKKLIYFIGLLVLAFIIITIVNLFVLNDNTDEVTFNASVIENNGTSLLVSPVEGSSELNSSDKIVVRVPVDNATLKDLSEFTVGSIVKITYDGMIMESYPAQINAYNVERVEN